MASPGRAQALNWRRGSHPGGAPLVLAPIAAGSASGATGSSALLGAGVAGMVIATTLPWSVLFGLFAFAALYTRGHGLTVAGASIQPADLFLVPLAARVLFLTDPRVRPRWEWPEWILIVFVGLQFVTSLLNAVHPMESFLPAGLLAVGALAYLTTYTGLCTRRRLITGARLVLLAGLASASIGVLTTLAHYLLHVNILSGVTAGQHAQGASQSAAPKAFTFEHDIFGSFAASSAISFLVLMRESNPLFSRRFCVVAFWICTFATLASLTRGAWIAFAVAGAAVFVFRQRRQSRWRMVGQAGLLALGIGVVGIGALWLASQPPTSPVDTGLISISSPVTATGSQLLNFSTGSGAGRLEEWKVALQDLKQSPLIGLGTNSYGQRHIAPKSNPRNPSPGYIGDLYVRTLYDSGIVGLLLLMFFLVRVVWPRRLLQLSTGDLAPVARSFIFGYAALAVAFGATDASLQVWPWIILGCARAAGAMAAVQYWETGRPADRGRRRAVAPAGARLDEGGLLGPGPRSDRSDASRGDW